MKDFKYFCETQADIQRQYVIFNIFITVFVGYGVYVLYQLINFDPSHSILAWVLLMSLAISLVMGLMALNKSIGRNKAKLNMVRYIRHVIAKSRLTGNYSDLNTLLNSKYSIPTLLIISQIEDENLDKYIEQKPLWSNTVRAVRGRGIIEKTVLW